MSSLALALIFMWIPVIIVGIIVFKFLKDTGVINFDFNEDDDLL